MTQLPAEWTPREGRDLYLGDLLTYLRRYWHILAAFVLASVLIALAYTSLQVPTYRAGASLRIDENQRHGIRRVRGVRPPRLRVDHHLAVPMVGGHQQPRTRLLRGGDDTR